MRGRAPVSSVPYLPGLDGMRALAVVAVMVYHANSSWLPGGFIGVEVFFVISGYLITLLLIGEHERTGTVDLGQFWARRARRLLPALFVMMAILMAYVAVFQRGELGRLRGDVFAGLVYVSNWYQIWVGQGYTAAGEFAPLRHLWSLAVEEQFYVVWPLVMAALLRLGRRRLPDLARWLLLAAVAVFVVVGLAYYPGRDLTAPTAHWRVAGRSISKIDTLYLSTITRSTGLLIGAAFAMIWRPTAIIRGPLRTKAHQLDGLALVGLAGLGALAWYLHLVTPDGADPWLFRGGFLAVALATVLVMAAVTHEASFAGPALGNPALRWVGTRSYGLYLYHWPIYQVIRQAAGNHLELGEFVAAMAVTAAITEVSYRFVETPIRRREVGLMLDRLRDIRDLNVRRIVGVGATATVALVGFAAVSMVTAANRPSDFEQAQQEGAEVVTQLGTPNAAPQAETPTTVVAIPVTPVAAGPETTIAGAGPTLVPTTVAPTTPAPVVVATTVSGEPAQFTAIGDSVMEGAAPDLVDEGFVVDAHQNRQLVDFIPTLQSAVTAGQLGEYVVVHLGTNGTFTESQMTQFYDLLVDVSRVIVLTDYANRAWTNGNNDLILSLPSRYPNVQVLYWHQLAANCPGNCFYADGIHLRPDGQLYYTALIADITGA
ncbi:acyltransferase family protein [soil metagenome]